MQTIVHHSNILFNQKLNTLTKEKFTGKFKIKSQNERIEWDIYYCLGKIVWAQGGCHPHRSWLRALAKICPKIKLDKTLYIRSQKYECWRYRYLSSLLQIQQINKKEFSSIVKIIVDEIIFDIIHTQKKESLEYSTKPTSADHLLDCGLKVSFIIINTYTLIEINQKKEQEWSKFNEKFSAFSPNLAPNILNPELFKTKVNPNIYQIFTKYINGKNTLRDLSVKINRDLSSLTSSLIPYIHQQYIELKEIPDLPETTISLNFPCISNNIPPIEDESKRLIVCIDDSLQVLKIMEQIVIKQGYRFIGIQESLKAIPTLVTYKPDLIFLDLRMPIVNGYEICKQLRRVSQLKEIPIILLTSQDTMLDRVKAKMVGISEFLTKPIAMSKVINSMEIFLNNQDLMRDR